MSDLHPTATCARNPIPAATIKPQQTTFAIQRIACLHHPKPYTPPPAPGQPHPNHSLGLPNHKQKPPQPCG